MGAERQDIIIVCSGGSEELEREFEKIVLDAQYNYGHAGYTGTFAEKTDGLKIIPVPDGEKYWDPECAKNHSDEQDKWGPAYAYLIGKNKWLVIGWCSS